MKLSIVSTLYNSERYIAEFCSRAKAATSTLGISDFEIVLVNDGSPDNSLSVARELCRVDPSLVVVDLSRNFGHHKALMTGLAQARGDLVFLIDSDLEEDPEWMVEFHRQLQRESCEVVYGVQAERKGGLLERISGSVFYLVFKLLAQIDLPRNVVTARLMTRRYVDALLRHDEREVFLAGLWCITGFDQRPATVCKRSTSQSTYTLRRKIALLVNSITSFSNAPLIAVFYFGLAMLILSSCYIGYLVVHWMLLATPPSGWTSLMASTWLIGGLVISSIGVVGIYLSKIYSETKRRPYTIVRQIYGGKKLDDPR